MGTLTSDRLLEGEQSNQEPRLDLNSVEGEDVSWLIGIMNKRGKSSGDGND